MNKSQLTVLAAAIALAGCASTPRMGNVVPLAGGAYQVLGKGYTSEQALESALYSAETTCKARQRRHVITNQSTQYKGMVSEGANRAMNQAATVAAAVTKNWVPTLSSEDDYQITVGFTCESA